VTSEVRLAVDPDLLAPEELADRLILWGSRARQVLAERQQLLVVTERKMLNQFRRGDEGPEKRPEAPTHHIRQAPTLMKQ